MKKKPRPIEEINSEYAKLCARIGDAHSRQWMAEQEIKILQIELVALNEEATMTKKQEEPK